MDAVGIGRSPSEPLVREEEDLLLLFEFDELLQRVEERQLGLQAQFLVWDELAEAEEGRRGDEHHWMH